MAGRDGGTQTALIDAALRVDADIPAWLRQWGQEGFHTEADSIPIQASPFGYAQGGLKWGDGLFMRVVLPLVA